MEKWRREISHRSFRAVSEKLNERQQRKEDGGFVSENDRIGERNVALFISWF
jgi:hypothetical protein